MKTIFRTIIAALAATLTLVSCAKDELAGKDSTNPQSEGIRTIAVSFGVPTRSSLVGLQPSFDEDDEILVAQDDGMVEPEVCRVRNVGGKKVISTKLKGKLTLVYPQNAAQMDKSNENIIYGVYVSPSQSGRFEDANICMTKINSTATSANFENKVAILKFYVDESIGVTKLILSADDVYIASGSKSITVQAEDESLLRATGTSAPTLANTTDDSQHRICYVAVNPVTSKQMEVESWTRTQELSESNIVKRKYNDVRLAAGDIANVFVPYYIKVQVSSDPEKYQYWGYCNLGAFLPEEAGYYFSWGNRQGFISKYNDETETSEWIAPLGSSATLGAGGFSEPNYQGTPGSSLTGDIPATDANDAATFLWKDKWRLPTKSEFEAFCALSPSSSWGAYRGGTQKGLSVYNLFIPAVGHGDGENIAYTNSKGFYWTSTNGEFSAWYFGINSSKMEVSSAWSRHLGRTIRPIYGEPAGSTVDDLNVLEDDTNNWEL